MSFFINKAKISNKLKFLFILFLILYTPNISYSKNTSRHNYKYYQTLNNIKAPKTNTTEKEWRKFDGYLIGRIIIIQKRPFDDKDSNNPYIKNIYKTLNSLSPKIRPYVILSKLPFNENERIDVDKLIDFENKLQKITTIKDIEIVVEESDIDNTFVDIKIYFKNKFPLVINPFSKYFRHSNIFGTGNELSFQIYSDKKFIEEYEIDFYAPNLYNTDSNLYLSHANLSKRKHSKIGIDRPFAKSTKIGGGISFKTQFRSIKYAEEFNVKLKTYEYKYKNFNFWLGNDIGIWINNSSFYKKLVLTYGFNNHIFSKPADIHIHDLKIMNDKKSMGLGICFIHLKELLFKDTYGQDNNNIVHEGNKLYLYGGIIDEEIINNRNYIAVDFAKGIKTSLGYFYLNQQIMRVTEGYYNKDEKSEKKTISPITSFDTEIGYISKKINLGVNIRKIFTINYLGRFGDDYNDIIENKGFHYIDYYLNSYFNIKHKFELCYETILYNPYKIFSIAIDPFFFIEGLFVKLFEVEDKKNEFNNKLAFGTGLFISPFGWFNIKLAIALSPTHDKQHFHIVIGKSFTLPSANIFVSSPTYKPFKSRL